MPSHFIEVQQQFMAHIRDPAHNAKPADVEERRMAIYRDLFFNNVDGFVSSAFPVLKSLYKDAEKGKIFGEVLAAMCESMEKEMALSPEDEEE